MHTFAWNPLYPDNLISKKWFMNFVYKLEIVISQRNSLTSSEAMETKLQLILGIMVPGASSTTSPKCASVKQGKEQ